MRCPFCEISPERIVARTANAYAIRDGYPVNRGHSLIIPFRHVSTWFEASAAEQSDIMALVDQIKVELENEFSPDGFNVGFNTGEAAGQTVMHLHVHVIPRFCGDVDDPTGGVRLVIPSRGNYRRPGHIPVAKDGHRAKGLGRAAPLATGGAEDPFIAHLEPLFAEAREIAILAAFVQDSGVVRLRDQLYSCLERGARVRILTGDYLNITQARALRHLLDLVRGEQPDGTDDCDDRGELEARVVEVEALVAAGLGRSFHPKAWIFSSEVSATAFVGSSNMSKAALTDGVEWNLRIERDRDAEGFAEVTGSYERWWQRGRVLDDEWLAGYVDRAMAINRHLPVGELDAEYEPPPEPWDLQQEALDQLRTSRLSEHRMRSLAVLATGLGKTWLAAFDVQQFADELGRSPRVLFLAHRVELLRQAAGTFRRMFPDLAFGWFVGTVGHLTGDVVFASIMKLGRPEHLFGLPPDTFDYVIVDEVHHADAKNYRRILGHLRPRFLLGLTATPERADAGDILGLFDDNVVYRADIGVGIEAGHLVPFHYFGIKDAVDYAPIPWRNRRFEPSALGRAVQTEARMGRAWEAMQKHPGQRTLVFCCSIAHSRYAQDWLAQRGVRVAAVHSGADSADRTKALAQLRTGQLDAVCTVDLFNEGIDVPAIDRVLMLRPTESPVIFLQQLGRGLRCDPNSEKEALVVIDFVGNHRVFLDRVRMLVNLAPDAGSSSVTEVLAGDEDPVLPVGCSLDIELEAVDMLRKLISTGAKEALVRGYRELRDARGERPTLGELYRLGLNPGSLKAYDGWFEFVAAEGDLTDAEHRALGEGKAWLFALERQEAMTKSFKMVALKSLLDADALDRGQSTRENAEHSFHILHRSPELDGDLGEAWHMADAAELDLAAWEKYWISWPLKRWTGADRRKSRRAWFRLREQHFEPTFRISAENRDTLSDMTSEVVDYRLARYRLSKRAEASSGDGVRAFECKLIQTKGRPIVKLPDRTRFPWVPTGETDVRLVDSSIWRFRFVKLYCNVAHPVGSSKNQLPDLVRSWFGPDAGQPGTEHRIKFIPYPDGWWVEPLGAVGAEIIPFPTRGSLVSFPSLRAAAGWDVSAQDGDSVEATTVNLPGDFDREQCFAVRASGSSMQGWRNEIRDGDWLVMRWSRGAQIGALNGRVALIARGDPEEGRSFHLKRIKKVGGRYLLVSDNPDFEAIDAGVDDEPIAQHVKTVRPEDLGPALGAHFGDSDIVEAFRLSQEVRPPSSRVDGHLFIMAEGAEILAEPDRLRATVPGLLPAETAYVLARRDTSEPWTYLGVGYWQAKESTWAIPAVDFATWRSLGKGRTASKRLDERWVSAATQLVDDVLGKVGAGGWVDAREKRCRVVGKSRQGGLRIDGGSSGFAERTVSTLDIGWVLLAQDENPSSRGIDEAFVNRCRYLEGTPKGSTRWIDTGWALVLVDAQE